MQESPSSTRAPVDLTRQAEGETAGDPLDQQARNLAASQREVRRSKDLPLFTNRLPGYRAIFLKTVQHFRGASEQELSLSYAAEWILDNDFLVITALRQIEENLPPRYEWQLPRLVSGSLQNYPRVYALALEQVLSSRAELDLERVERFVEAYQAVTPLTMGELWALPIMLRLVVLQALLLAAIRLTGAEERLDLFPVQPDEWRDDETVAHAFISLRALDAYDWKDFFERLSLVDRALNRDPAGVYARMEFETRDRYRKVIEDLALANDQEEAGIAQETVRLAETYHRQAAGEQNGRFLESSPQESGPDRRSHVGFYLISAGHAGLERQIGYRPSAAKRIRRWIFAHATPLYLGSLAALTLAFLAAVVAYAQRSGGAPWQAALAALLTLIPAQAAAVYLVNWIVTHAIPPRVLPKMDYSDGIPARDTSLVVVPALLTGAAEVRSLLDQLEQHYLRNPDPQLFFALLSDFADASEPHPPKDDELLELAVGGIQALNQKYPRASGDPFLLLHRERRWNPKEGAWMGWERKRGKLHELNELILSARGKPSAGTSPGVDSGYRPSPNGRDQAAGPAGFAFSAGNLAALAEVRYVITLDADTVLPPDSARRLVATLAHPLNRAVLPVDRKVEAGYSILQPRLIISPTSAVQSIFTRIFAGDTGLDLYTLAVSDVYQDLFGEGIYVGKGIYDVEAFERSLAGRVPENTLLSHDLFEGLFARAGLVTDAVLIEDYPSRYLVRAQRMHRWIRGDWQLLPWLFPSAPKEQGILPNRLTLLDRWKILDNLRRSLVLPALLALFTAAWLGWLPGAPPIWTLAGLLVLAMPLLTGIAAAILQMGRTEAAGGSARHAFESLRADFFRWLLSVTFLPYEALLSLNAIAVTLTRVFVTRRNLLRWTTAAQSEQRLENGSGRSVSWREMSAAPAAALLLAVLLAFLNPQGLLTAALLLGLWFFSPEIASWISQPVERKPAPVTDQEREKLRSLARRTWLFFEQFVGPEDHWLPPDHFQEAPLGTVAHRTSPTNIGLSLLATLGAYDLGYTGLLSLSARLHNAFESLARLERFRGHFLNWYDTHSLEPLQPRYVSTVDSGNLAASLLALRQGLLEQGAAPVLRRETFAGLLDGLELVGEHLEELSDGEARKAASRVIETLSEIQLGIRSQMEAAEKEPEQWAALLFWLSGAGGPGKSSWAQLDERMLELAETAAASLGAEGLRRLRLYAGQVRQRLDNAQREIEMLLPWLKAFAQPPELFSRPDLGPELSTAWQDLRAVLPAALPLGQIESAAQAAGPALERLLAYFEPGRIQNARAYPTAQVEAARDWCLALAHETAAAGSAAGELLNSFAELVDAAEAYVQEMNFAFLFDPERQVFHIGSNLEVGRLDNNYYDLLASEARVTSLIAISKGEVPQSHWLHLARPLTQVDGRLALLSWSATMFEYLMPRLLVRDYEGTLLKESSFGAAGIQMLFGRTKSVPWGISESGYYRFDPGLAYQYRAFGVPGLGYKRGLGEDLVIAPYASLLALPLYPQAVVKNIADLERLGALGTFGLYEALDFTPVRLALGTRYELVREYMAHHQGMILLSLVNYLLDDRMVERFHRDPRIRSVELLLQEQLPPDAPLERPHIEEGRAIRPEKPQVIMTPWRARIHAPRPRVHYLSNGRYGLLITASGGGYSAWRDLELTRWRADATLGGRGTWIYIQDLESGRLWSAGYEPAAQQSDRRDVYFSAHMASLTRQDGAVATTLDITVAPDEDVEVRRLSLTNHSDDPVRLRLTSYAEVVLAPPAGDRRHPAFSNLFVESEFAPDENTLLFRRRPRSEAEEIVYLAHCLVPPDGDPPTRAYESDRARFLGRAGTTRAPQALAGGAWLSGTSGATLDPILSLGQELTLQPHTSLQVAWLTLVAPGRQEALALASHYSAWSAIERVFDQARAAAEVEMLQLGLHTTQLPRIQHLLSALIYPNPALRAPAETLQANRKGQPGLWPYAISGDYPILLARLESQDELALVQDLLQAHAYWRNRQLKIDLVFLNEEGVNYGQELSAQLHRLFARTGSDAWLNRRGGIFLVLADQLSQADRVLLETAARVVLDGKMGGLDQQLPGAERLPPRLPAFVPSPPDFSADEPAPPVERPVDLRFDNGLGGFSPDGREYVIYLEPGSPPTPAPWINVIANPEFGFLVSESGLGYSWAVNSGENRLTPWSNDPVTDPSGEALYLRDEETAEVWSPTPLPAPAESAYLVRHGAGYTIFEHNSHGLKQRLRLFAAPDAPVKIVQLRLENTWSRLRRITATYFAEWVLGVNREDTQQYIIPEYEGETQALLAFNPYNVEFGERVAFAAASQRLHGLTADRNEFLGRLGDRALPGALKRIGLAGMVRPGIEPCAALQLHLDLQPGEAQEVYFLLGQGEDREAAVRLVRQYQESDQVAGAWEEVVELWDRILGAVTVRTPDPAMDLLLNRWLMYQTLASRLWGRTAFYQSSGAYGFRDQLQDVMALLLAAPHLAREHLLRSARHQFDAGDVLHWWHPPSGRGVRTRFSDDLLWLPFVTASYVEATGDLSVLQETVPFLTAPPLEPEQDERYGQYASTPDEYSLYEHCLRALDRGTTSGPHGLPLMGSGDWNDGMNRVGIEGQGESVWLAWFLTATLRSFAGICERRGETEQAERMRQTADGIVRSTEEHAWDGDWYLRAFYDGGAPLGSSQNRECQIDSIAQSWAVLSGAGDPPRSRQAMQAVSERLVRLQDRLILLFTPPFDQTLHDPGYIKGYLPGVRENGGQYTHAAIWTVWGFAQLGQGDYAGELFSLLNPIYHSDTRAKAVHYKVEPYVVAADIYSVPPHTGRGGWTWYSGSSGWMYRLGIEGLLGLRRVGGQEGGRDGDQDGSQAGGYITLDPCIPKSWPNYEIVLRHGNTEYWIEVLNPEGVNRGVCEVSRDGKIFGDGRIPLVEDGGRIQVRVRLGKTGKIEKPHSGSSGSSGSGGSGGPKPAGS